MLAGRKKEMEYLKKVAGGQSSGFVAIYGRRRVGKTFLVHECFGYRFTFHHAGLSEGSTKEQLFAFASSLKSAGYEFERRPSNWLEAFDGLKELIKQSKEKRKVVFIDELSWMDTKGSNFITALENFWNGFASARKDIMLVVCSSSTSWTLSKIVHNKGGLYNRLTGQINLQPFTLGECEEYVKAAGLALNREQILQYYMVFGGVPFYWTFLEKGLSLPMNIDNVLFAANASLKDEFKYLYASIFRSPDIYIKIVETLGIKKAGMTREELIASSGIANTGDLSKKLDELECCGFIRKYFSFGKKKKNAVYQLVDFFTLFYYKFLVDGTKDEHFFANQINTPAINAWMGLAFERVCMMHIEQIKKKLGISGVLTDCFSWRCKGDPDKGVFGTQIDLLIVRKDQVINLCEMKYSDAEYSVTKKNDSDMKKKISDLRLVTGTKYAVYPTLVTTYGMVENSYSSNLQSVVVLDDLFE